jgi:anaerobic selenocysteine-containing dehydrogenase
MDWILAPSGLTMAELGAHPGGMPVPAPLPTRERAYEERGFPTPSGKMEFASGVLERHAAQLGVDPLPAYVPPGCSAEPDAELAAEYPFVLSSGSRLPMFIHSRTYRLPWTRALRPEPAADLNPADARRLGVAQGDLIELATPAAAIRVHANLTELGQPGVVYMYHGCPEADVNLLLDAEYLDPVSGFPGYKGVRCRVTRVGAEGGRP